MKKQAEELTQDEIAWDFADNANSQTATLPENLNDIIGRAASVDIQESEIRKGRFILESKQVSRPSSVNSELTSASNSQENIHQLVGPGQIDEGEVKKGRFSVREQKESPNIERDTDSNENSGDEKRTQPQSSNTDVNVSKPPSRNDPASAYANDESSQNAEEKRGRFQVYADSAPSHRSTESGRFSIQELQDQICGLLKMNDQQRLLLQEVHSKLEQFAIDKVIASSNFEKQTNILRKEYEELKKENERLRVTANKLV